MGNVIQVTLITPAFCLGVSLNRHRRVFEADTPSFYVSCIFGRPIIQSCLRDLNHPFDQRPEAGRLPSDASQAGIVSASTVTCCRDVGRRLAGLDFDIRAFGKFGGGDSCCVARRSQYPAAQLTAVTGRCGLASGVLRDKRSLHHFRNSLQKRKLWAVAPSPICGQQIGQMRA